MSRINKPIRLNNQGNWYTDEPESSSIFDYKLVKILGKGAFGKVYLAENKDGEHVSIKEIQYKSDDYYLISEIQVLKHLSDYPNCNENVVCIIDAFIEVLGINNKKVFIVMEYVNGNTLEALYISQNKVPISTLWQIMKQMISGLRYIHSKNVIHKDIKLANIIHDMKSNNYKFLDFGMSCTGDRYIESNKVERRKIACSIGGTPRYLPPEYYYKSKNQDYFKYDIWALGVCFYLLANGHLHYPERIQKREELGNYMWDIREQENIKSDYRSDEMPEFAFQLNLIIEMCLIIDPETRPDIEELYKWITELEIKYL